MSKDWEQYEKQIFKEFKNKYLDQDISYSPVGWGEERTPTSLNQGN